MSWLTWIVVGAIAGAIAKLLMPGRDPGGFIITILLGIIGAIVAGVLGEALNIYDSATAGFWAHLVAGIIGAVIILIIYRLVRRPASRV